MFIRAVSIYIIISLPLLIITCGDDIAINSKSKIHTWEGTYGIGDTDVALSVIQTADGAFVAAGYTLTYEGGGYPNVYLFKVDSLGDLLWEYSFGEQELMKAASLLEDLDGGFLIMGTTSVGDGLNSDILLLKMDASGNLLWQKKFGRDKYEAGHDMVKTADGGFVIAGETRSFGLGATDAYLVKLNANCDLEWQAAYGTTGFDYAESVVQTPNGGYILVGNTDSFIGGIFIVGVDMNGLIKWQKSIGGEYDVGLSIIQSDDGNFVIGAVTFPQSINNPDVLLTKIDSSANIIWQNTYGGTSTDIPRSLLPSSDGSCLMVGATDSFGAGEADAFLVKVNSYGNIVWQRTYGGTDNESANCIAQTSDGGFILAGDKDQEGTWKKDAYLIKTDANGDL